jgi:TolA-binding protein
MKAPVKIGRISLGWPHLVFGAVLVLRLVSLFRLSGSSLLLPSRGDMHFYDAWAQRILGGEWSTHLAFYGLPGYAYLLAFLYRLFGYNPFIPGLLQAIVDASTALVIYSLTLWAFEQRSTDQAATSGVTAIERIAALAAAAGWAFFVPAQAYAVILMPTTWFVFVFWFVIWRVGKNKNVPGLVECFALGLLVGITATAVANILVLVPLIVAALLVKRGEAAPWSNLVRGIVLTLIGVGIGTAPCWIHNYFVAHDPVFLSAHSGINLWIGNNPDANGYPRFPPGLHAGQAAMLQDSITQAESAAGRGLKHSEVSAYWSAKATSYIATHFIDWLKLLGLKLRNFWSAFQYDDLSVITNLREQGVVFPGFYFGVVAALGIPGLFFAAWLAPRARWIILATLLSMFGLLTVFITERYRLVAVPGLLILAVFGLSILWQSFVRAQFGLAAAYLAILIGAMVLLSTPQRKLSLWALDAYNSGWQALESNNLTLAEKKLATAYAYVPANSETNFALGNLRLAENNSTDARSFYQAVLRFDPQHKGAFNNLGVIALDEKDYSEAEKWFRRAEGVDPRNAKTHFLLAKTLFARNDLSSARGEIDSAIQLNPNQPEFIALRQEIDQKAP